jgi:hypothetical protein
MINSCALKLLPSYLYELANVFTRKENSYHMLELEIINFKKINESTNADLMTQIVEAKKKEEAQKIEITKKEESCQMFELEAIKLKRIQIEYEEEIKILKTKVFDLTKEMEELKTYDKTIKCKEVLDETEEIVINLKTHLGHAKEVEEALKIQLTKKEELCHMLKLEIVNLKKMNEKTNKIVNFQNSSAIFDKIWKSQKSADDKTGLGYNKKEDNNKWSTIYKDEKGSSFLKGKDASTKKLQVMNFVKEDSFRSKKEEENQMTDPSSQNKIKNGNTFNGYCFSCHSFGHKAIDCKKLKKGYTRKSKNSIRCWRCNFVGHTTKFCHTMRCYNCDRFGHKSQNCKNTKSQYLNKSFKSMTNPNKSWKKKGDDKSPKTQLEREDPKSRISHRKIWRRKSEGESKKDVITPENEEINNKNMMGKSPNKECEIQYEINQSQEKEVPIEEYGTILNYDDVISC